MEISRANCAGGDVLKLRGDIEAGDYAKFRSFFGDERSIVGLDLESTGGSLREGVLIAALTRQKRLSTFVAKECDSACAFIFLMGRKRYAAREAKIGVHAVGNDYGGEDNGTLRDTIRFARVSAKLGIPSSIIGKMVTTLPREIAFLDQTDLSALRVIMRDPFAGEAGEGNRSCTSDPAAEASADRNTPVAGGNTSHRREKRSGKQTELGPPINRTGSVARAP